MFDKLFEKTVSKIPFWCLYLCLPVLLWFVMSIGSSLKRDSGLSKNWLDFIVICLIVFFAIAFFSVLRSFRKKQKIWLQQHGYKVIAKYKNCIWLPEVYRVTNTPHTIIYVEAMAKDKTRTFASDLIASSIGRFFALYDKLNKRLESYAKNHPEGFEVFISPDNPHVYWVNTTTLKDFGLGIDFSNS
jgi:hypothetical protein